MRHVIEIFAVVLFFLFFIWAVVFSFNAYTCNGYQEATGKNTKTTSLDCYIEDNGKWYVWGEYKYRLATKGQFN